MTPHTCMGLVLRAERVFGLLGHPLCVSIENQLAIVIKRLPRAVGNVINIHSPTNPGIKGKYNDLKDFVKVIDDTFKKDISNKHAKFKHSAHRPHNGNSHINNRNINNNNNRNGKRQHVNIMQHDKGRSRSRSVAKIPTAPYTSTCDHCGMKGHRIRDCRKASNDIIVAWYKQLNERKNAKRKQPDEAKP